MTDLEFCQFFERVADPYKDGGFYVLGYSDMANLVAEVWDAALDAAKKKTVRGLLDATEKEKRAHYTACKGIGADIENLKLSASHTVPNAKAERPETAAKE